MWNLKDSNVRVGVYMKVQSFKKHLNNLRNTKSSLSMRNTQPWKPTFRLSKTQNRYQKKKQKEIDQENSHLTRRIISTIQKPILNTFVDIPLYIPSNKQNYKLIKARERNLKQQQIQKQNSVIIQKITLASKSYERKNQQKDWKTSRVYNKLIRRNPKCYDYKKLAEQNQKNFRNTHNQTFRFKNSTCNSEQTKRIMQNRSEVLFQKSNSKFKKIY